MCKSVGRVPSLRILPWHLPYNWGKKHGKTSVRVRKTSVRIRKISVRVRKTSARVYVIQIAFRRQPWLRERPQCHVYTCIACLVHNRDGVCYLRGTDSAFKYCIVHVRFVKECNGWQCLPAALPRPWLGSPVATLRNVVRLTAPTCCYIFMTLRPSADNRTAWRPCDSCCLQCQRVIVAGDGTAPRNYYLRMGIDRENFTFYDKLLSLYTTLCH
jgi:hypothetical protein